MASLDTLTPDEVRARLSGVPEVRVALIREGAEAGLAEAQAVYGQMLLDGAGVEGAGLEGAGLDGAGVPCDPVAALGWFVRAAAQHHVMALNMVGRCYDLGWGTVPDKAKAAACYRVAAERGLDWAMYNYATLLTLGEGVSEDKAAALGWLRRAERDGTGLAQAKAVNVIGSFHEDGWATPRDMTAAAECYARAAEGGDFRGCFNHARMLGAAGDVAGALAWLTRAGELGNARFVAKAAAWLAASDLAAFRTEGVAALREGAAC